MAHAHTELELGPGVNALTGPNNTGKSAIVEALRCLATNPVPRHYIRHGAKEARVSVELEDGTRVVWIRKKRSSGYELYLPGAEEPEEYWKFGRRPPEDILKVLRLDLVELETGGEIDVHVGNQREPVFLLNQPGSNAAAFFAASTESAHLLAMQNRLKRRTQDARRTERELETRIREVESEMAAYAPLPDIELGLESARELDAAARGLQTEIPVLEKGIETQARLWKDRENLQERARILDGVEEVSSLHDVAGLALLLKQMKLVELQQNVAVGRSGALASLQESPAGEPTTQLAQLCDRLQAVESNLRKAVLQQDVMVSLTEPPLLQNAPHLLGIMNEILASRSRLEREERCLSVLQNIAEPPEVASLSTLESVVDTVHGLTAQKVQQEAKLGQLETELQSLTDHIEQRLDEMGRCPTCGGRISAQAFLERRCDHEA